ncbi:MAG: hypothetical protein NVSMB14_13060 [Isosphaeraceae bacterium]
MTVTTKALTKKKLTTGAGPIPAEKMYLSERGVRAAEQAFGRFEFRKKPPSDS